MTWRNWGWYGGYRWMQAVVSAFISVMFLVLYLDDATPDIVRAIIAVGLLATLILVYAAHPWITITADEVRLGYFPLYRKIIPIREIKEVSTVIVDPVRAYSGYGVRGLAKSKRGILLGGYPKHALRFETVDDRRYIITLRDLDPVVQELVRIGCTISAGNGDEFSREV